MIKKVLLMGLVFAIAGNPKSELNAEQELENNLRDILDDERLEHAISGVHVRSAETGEELFSHEAHTSLTPASGQKVLVGAAALDTLGSDYTFETGVYANGEQTGAALHGDLYLKGEGDPTMLAEDYEDFAREVSAQGINVVHGDVVADDTFFDDERLPPDLAFGDESCGFGAQTSALTASPDEDFDAGTVIVEVEPGDSPGDEAEVSVTPETDYVTIDDDVETTAEDSSENISIEREHGTNDIVVEGDIPVDDDTERTWISVWEPTEFAQHLFHSALKEEGIQIQGDLKLGETPEEADPLVVRESMPLEELFTPYMKLSNNGHAETMTKTMARVVEDKGSWDEGLDIVEDYLSDAGLNIDAIQLRDGSGMSHLNYIPPHEMTALLEHIQGEDWYDILYESLPIAGVEDDLVGGTLSDRMEDTEAEENVHAKTGTLTSITSLSGYVTTQDGEELIFSIILNNFIGDAPEDIEDDIVVELAMFSRDGG
ncbi:D-alanyl-D-alanine carboxypeptidase/D-alanyl-D-alanine endopeptidase [Natribacillus halophilus]|uniref:D-alanyl-D-alanine carboxypeptidase / D-alanyl-D-alanine-endopeptidase (Penicillin-binding protein 4) n=1 Tax=Natribacillus halophilus TaxID=549003 RepID=A0A1G8KDE9_9BACI|nr:D-alanyl-D-alanine carboxypeptidase/D-alanyl-D-alanine-endopeptidase [Natribacillus halophilus]SDI41418.1 D-alanyl-D-alanine carboxypeptidase / D-alanyl-D-alanine-endopeptidase (penicillin-binding protein 4) [Natribacillus halophilus]